MEYVRLFSAVGHFISLILTVDSPEYVSNHIRRSGVGLKPHATVRSRSHSKVGKWRFELRHGGLVVWHLQIFYRFSNHFHNSVVIFKEFDQDARILLIHTTTHTWHMVYMHLCVNVPLCSCTLTSTRNLLMYTDIHSILDHELGQFCMRRVL